MRQEDVIKHELKVSKRNGPADGFEEQWKGYVFALEWVLEIEGRRLGPE